MLIIRINLTRLSHPYLVTSGSQRLNKFETEQRLTLLRAAWS